MFNLFGKMWIATSDDLKDILLQEEVIQHLRPEKDRLVAHRIFASLYARYVILINNLSEIYDQCLQVQKRQVIQNLLINATLRLKELEKELTNIEMSQFFYLDQSLIETKIIPENVQFLRPWYFPMKRPKELQDIIDGVRPVIVEEETATVKETFEEKRLQMIQRMQPKLTADQIEEKKKHAIITNAVNLIKTHEKARQSRNLFTKYKYQLYKPKPLPGSLELNYDYQHKPDQRMFKPITRTTFREHFYQNLKACKSNLQLYESPKWRLDPNVVVPKVDINNLFDEIVIPVKEEVVVITEDVDENTLKNKFAILNNAASVIQRTFHRYHMKKLINARHYKKLKIYGMIDDRKCDYSKEKINEVAQESRRNQKDTFDRRFVEICQDTKARILKLRGPWIMEDISDQIRAWFREWYSRTLSFDRYPEEFLGGTIIVVWGQTRSIEEYVEWKREKDAEAAMSADKKKALAEKKKAEKEKFKETKKKAKQQAKKALAEKKKREAKEGKTWEFNEKDFITKNFINLQTTMDEYEHDWCFIDEYQNKKDHPYTGFIEAEKYMETHKELRLIVDKLMRIEHELLAMSLAKDMKKKFKPQKDKKIKKKKDKKKKQKLDPFKDRPLHDLFDELISLGIIKSYSRLSLDKYIGDLNYGAFEQRNIFGQNPIHFDGEIKQIIRSALLGYGPITLPSKISSFCIFGPPMSGKRMLVDSICSEINAVLFDISPNILANIQDMKYLIGLLSKLAKLFQPAVFYVRDCHKTFYKKVPPTEKDENAKKISSFITRFNKNFKKDKIMLIGTTHEPWKGKLAKLKKSYEESLYIPPPDYSSTFLRWRHFCLAKPGVDRNYNFSPLAMVTRQFSSGKIYKTVEETLNVRRRMKLSRDKLNDEELLSNLLSGTPFEFPTNQVDAEKFLKFYRQINKNAGLRFKMQEEARLATENANKKK